MKQIIFWIGLILVVVACSTPKGIVKVNSVKGQEMPEDSVEYTLETFDTRFETWYELHNSPALYRSQTYYENWNKQYVIAWNLDALDPKKSWFFEPIIGYDPTVDYGFELNHKLFYYFQYVERVLKIQIMPGGPQSIPL